MKTKIFLFAFIFMAGNHTVLKSQDLSGYYSVTGYFFHPSSPRAIDEEKTITKIRANTYEVDLGDLPGWSFQFTIDANNKLTNWVATGSTFPAPASGFMTEDNPGGFIYTGPPYPGTSPWVKSTYNNTYDPATHTFYMHYGYSSSATSQNGYDRQIYEKYVLIPSIKINSATPLNGTAFTKVTIKGKNFMQVDPSNYTVSFGNELADTAWVVSDTKIIAKVGFGTSGDISIIDTNSHEAKLPGFLYTPVPPVTDPGWSYVGKAGFSKNNAKYASAASGSNNIPYVAFVDSVSQRTKLMKLSNNKWVGVGSYVSAGKSSFTDIVLTKNNKPIVAFVDSTVGGKLTVKELSTGNWLTLGSEGFAKTAPGWYTFPYSLAINNNDIPYVASTSNDSITVYKFQNNKWTIVGRKNFAYADVDFNLTIDKKSNTPYIIFRENISGNAVIMKYDGAAWVTVGPAISNSVHGAFYTDVEIDKKGNVFASFQDDNGFERESVFKFNNNTWKPVGPLRFSKGRTHFNELLIDGKNTLYVLFSDDSYNKQGTVMKYDNANNTWKWVGARGFIPEAYYFGRDCLFFDTANVPMVVFSDKTKNGKISVMKYDGPGNFTNEQFAARDNVFSADTNAVINIFPNPVNDILNVQLPAIDANATLQIVNSNGNVMMEKELTSNGKNIFSLDISKFTAGHYIMLFKTVNGVYSKQFIKQ